MERAQEIARSQPDPEAMALQPVATDRRRRTLAVVLAAALGGPAALSACEHLDSDAPSSMGPTWLHAD